MKTIRYETAAALAAILAVPAMAQSAPVEFESEIEAVTVIGALHDTRSGTDSEDVLYEISLDNRIEKVLENGLQIGGRLTLRGQRDHPSRPGFTGDFGRQAGPRGAYSGLSGQSPRDDKGARGRVEAAYIEFDGGYGELRAGRDRGVAARFHEGAPSVLTHAGINNPYLDPDGVKILRTNHDLTGPSAKLSYASPRLLGLRAGLSYTPDSEARGLDRDVDAGPLQPDLSQSFEAALNLSRRLREPDVRFEAGLAWSSALVDTPLAGARDRVQTFSAGANLEFPAIAVGGSWLTSNNGFMGADYTAWEIGAAREFGGTGVSINYGEAEDELAGLESESFSLAASRRLGKNLVLAAAYQDEALSTAGQPLGGKGIVVEITLTGNFLEISPY